MTKASHIRKLLLQGHSNAEIAEAAGCQESYVRTIRQRTDAEGRPRKAPGEVAYEASEQRRADQMKRKRQWYARNRDSCLEKMKAWHRKEHRERYGIDMEWTERRRQKSRESWRRRRAAERAEAQS